MAAHILTDKLYDMVQHSPATKTLNLRVVFWIEEQGTSRMRACNLQMMLLVRGAGPALLGIAEKCKPYRRGSFRQGLGGAGWMQQQLRHFLASRHRHRHHRHAEKTSWKTASAKLSTSCGNVVRLKKRQHDMPIEDSEREHIAWWQERMTMCRKAATQEMIKRLVFTNLLGLDGNLRNGSLKEGTLNADLLEVKRRFPHEVLLCRVGEFYEACGFDACILVEFAGLNPMGGVHSDSAPRAGCPIANLRQTLDEITNQGFSVCIVEEVQGPVQAKQRKDRFIAGHAHPGSPYIYGLAGADMDIEFPEPYPVIGISQSIRGYCLITVLEMMRTYSVEDELTEEGVVTKLRSMQCQQLFLHRSLRENSAGSVRWGSFGEGGLLWGECKGKFVEWFDQDPVTQLLAKVKEMYDIDEAEEFREIVRPSFGRPRPIYLGTASQIGVILTPGIPSLLKVLVPSDCPGLCVRYLRDLLLNPPPYNVSASIQDVIRLMAGLKCSIPEFLCVPAAKLVKLIGAKEVNHIEFSRLRILAEDVLYMYHNDELREILHLLLEPTCLATGLKIEADYLINDCNQLVDKVLSVIARDGDREQQPNGSAHIPDEFFNDMESGWKGRVQRRHAEAFYADVDEKAAELIAAIEDDFVPIIMRTKSLMPTCYGNGKGEICYVREHQSIWFKGKGFKPVLWGGETLGEEQIKRLKPALDSKGKKIGDDWHTTARVETALERYQDAVLKANLAVVQTLRNLADDLKKYLNTVIFVSVFCVIVKALFAHVSEGKRRKWIFPELATQQEDSLFKSDKLILTDLVPYWLDTTQDFAVPNSLEMNSLFLLTGPNGGGKSSLLRSVCAASLLGICGLMIPATKAVIPQFDSIMLRVMSQDSPSEGKSFFQMEMAELRTILLEATEKTLVLIDELCKGTEVQKGTCIVASVVEKMDRLGCLGIVSTHLHGLLDLELNVKNVVLKAMGTREVGGQLEPTWKLEDGECRESLAFETAKREGVPDEILQRASQLYKAFQQNKAASGNIAEIQHSEVLPKARKLLGDNVSGRNPPSLVGTISPPADTGRKHPKTLKDVEDAFLNICRTTLGQSNGNNLPGACGLVGARQQPPPFTSNHSCVYMLQRPDGKFYIGQTDNLAGRIASHRSSAALKQAPFLYLPVSNKSVACHLETALICQLARMGLELVNKLDQKHKHFGISPVEAPPF